VFLRTALIALVVLMAGERAAFSLTINEFEAVIASHDEVKTLSAIKEVEATNSPEFIVRAERLLAEHQKRRAVTTEEKALRTRLLTKASGISPRSRDQELWVSRAQFDLGRHYLKQSLPKSSDKKKLKLEVVAFRAQAEAKAAKLFADATENGHAEAPALLASIVKKTDIKRAEALFRLSLSRGNVSAEQGLADIEKTKRLQALGVKE
jgi:TPR repeat protein